MSNDNSTPDELPDPPDDFGAALLAEFAKRGTTIPDADDEPPGGWPGGATADAMFDIESAAKAANAAAVESASDGDEPGDGESVPPADATGDAPPATTPADEATTAPVTDPTGTDGDQPAAGMQAPAAGYTWRDGDQEHTFTDDEVRRGIILDRWASTLSEETRQAFGAIEAGQAVAISRQDYEQFAAFKAQQERQTRDADLSDLEAIDPEVAKIIAQQRDEIAQLRQGMGQQQQPDQYANLRSNLDTTAAQIDQATRTYASAANIPYDQAEQLLSAATNSGVFRHFAEAQAQRHPMTGQVVAPPNWNTVVKAALDYARQQMNGQPAPQPAQQPATPPAQHTDPNPPPDPGITAKKARAASVASAPSGAVPPPRPAKQLTQAERIQAMADEIAAGISNG